MQWDIIPINYQLEFEPDTRRSVFSGRETITATAKRATKTITLNAADIKIKKASVEAGSAVQQARIVYNQKQQQVLLKFDKPVKAHIQIMIDFEGVHNDKMQGFYRSTYDYKRRKQVMLTTQFEPVSARRAFVCIDQPAAKATYDITLIIDKKLQALSNMPEKRVVSIGKKKRVTFGTTPRMSTYLVYLGVGNFDILSSKTGSTTIRVITPRGRGRRARLAMEYAKKILPWFNSYFGIRYPLPKLDLIAVPDFAAGAMENWGAITFREILLQVDSQSPVSLKQRVAEVIAHEMAHQWFGDLVTMQWWDDLWLNESFATFMAYKAIDAIFPEWDIKTSSFLDVFGTAFAADQLRSTHPINVKVDTPEQVNEIFDEISYEKGGSVLHMLEQMVGREAFRRGLNYYLNRHAHANATKQDLWGAVARHTELSGVKVNVPRVMSYWVNTSGYPIVRARRNGKQIRLEQKRFTLSKDIPTTAWPIPLDYLSSDHRVHRQMMQTAKTAISAPSIHWVKLNYGQHSLFRVRYDGALLSHIGMMIKNGSMAGVDAWGIVNDLFALARSGRIALNQYLEFIHDNCMHAAYPLNLSVMGQLEWLMTILHGKRQSGIAAALLSEIADNCLAQTGWQAASDEDSNTKLVRSAAISSLGEVGERRVVERCTVMFNAYIKGAAIDNDIKSAVFSTVARNDGGKLFDKFVKLYMQAEIPEDKLRFLSVLGRFSDSKTMHKALAFSLGKHVRLQDAYTIPALIAFSPAGKDIIWEWTASRWKTLMKVFPPQVKMLDRYIENLSIVADIKTKKQIEKFFSSKANMRGDIKMEFAKALERIQANIQLAQSLGE